jgi:hypothetical protein
MQKAKATEKIHMHASVSITDYLSVLDIYTSTNLLFEMHSEIHIDVIWPLELKLFVLATKWPSMNLYYSKNVLVLVF